ncbi:hypothetical protein SCA6_006276 [Theobroma cacao]
MKQESSFPHVQKLHMGALLLRTVTIPRTSFMATCSFTELTTTLLRLLEKIQSSKMLDGVMLHLVGNDNFILLPTPTFLFRKRGPTDPNTKWAVCCTPDASPITHDLIARIV